MAYKTFAAIHVGSYELSMKIFEISNKNGIKQTDHIRHRIELGSDSYHTGKISNEKVEELCRILNEFSQIMKSYKVDAYKAYGTSAIREIENSIILLDRIQIKTGIKIEVLSNSEQRFLDYKSVASKGQVFQNVIDKSTVIIDIGGGSLQISLFEKDSLVTTQNIRPGILRMREELTKLSFSSYKLEDVITEIVCDRFESFHQMFIRDLKIKNIILIDDYVSFVLQKGYLETNKKGHADAKRFVEVVDRLKYKNPIDIATELGISQENIPLLIISALMIKHIINELGAEMIWAPGVSLCDGMAYEYAEKNKLLSSSDNYATHNFEQDILACARDINRRYFCMTHRTESLEKMALIIFDYMKKIHGLSKREKLLLQLAAILSECGNYISLSNAGENSYNIIMHTEIIGLSHIEREIVANVVKYSTQKFEYYDTLGRVTTLDRESYLKIAKLTAIMRLAQGLDISHRGKCNKLKVSDKGNTMILTVETDEDMTLELGLFSKNADFFEEVFNIKPIMKHKKISI